MANQAGTTTLLRNAQQNGIPVDNRIEFFLEVALRRANAIVYDDTFIFALNAATKLLNLVGETNCHTQWALRYLLKAKYMIYYVKDYNEALRCLNKAWSYAVSSGELDIESEVEQLKKLIE